MVKKISFIIFAVLVILVGWYFGREYIVSVFPVMEKVPPLVLNFDVEPVTQPEPTQAIELKSADNIAPVATLRPSVFSPSANHVTAYVNNNEAVDTMISFGNESAPVVTYSNLTFEVPSDIPDFFTRINVLDENTYAYAYTDDQGRISILVYGSKWRMENNIPRIELRGFWKASLQKEEDRTVLTDSYSTTPVSDHRPGIISQLTDFEPELPTVYSKVTPGIYMIPQANGEPLYRAVGIVNGVVSLYPSSIDGVIAVGSLPVDVETEASFTVGQLSSYPVCISGSTFATMLN